jgi:enediyne biosynthesis protein E4
MYSIKSAVIVLIIFTFFSCKKENNTSLSENTGFSLLDKSNTGINFSNDLKDNDKQNIIEYLYYYNGAGVGIGDINNDGLEDVFFASNQGSDKLYLNEGNFKFKDITEAAGISTDGSWSTGVSMNDVNNDGLIDIYVCRVSKYGVGDKGHNLLYINQGNNKFKESSNEMGLAFAGYSTNAAFLDYDKDGDLDMYLLNHTVHSVRSYGDISKRAEKDSLAGDKFFENRIKEEGKFIDVTVASGIYSSPLGYGLTVTCADVNNDGYMDIYVGNDFHENDYLYINNGNKTFEESIAKHTSHTTQFSMGADFGDINNDCKIDLFTTDMMPYDEDVLMVSGGEDADNVKRIKDDFGFRPQNARNHLQINQGDGTFSDIAYATKTFATDWSWSALMQDYDNNGMNDIFITSGIVKRPNDLDYLNYLNELDTKSANMPAAERAKKLIEKMPSQPLRNIIFNQNKPLEFTKIESSFIGKPSFSTGAAYGDLDNDGDLDIITNNINSPASIFQNNADKKSNYINIVLRDSFTTLGTKIIAKSKGSLFYRESYNTKGFLSSSTPKIHIGLGINASIDSLQIIWPDNSTDVIINPALNKTLVLNKKPALAKYNYTKDNINEGQVLLEYKHLENKFYDENNEKLIPERLSYDGPALLTEDLTGDGISDIYIGGGRNQPARLYIGNKGGTYTFKKTLDFELDAKYEDIDAASLDFDNDGDRDIYVISGGNDNKETDKINEDRVYMNNGNGVFKRIPISLPHTNGGSIAIADYDNDGYEDMFIGSRSMPGFYGLSPYSFILRNNGGRGLEQIDKQRHGMIKDAEWVDIDGDKDLDLVMCGDWMAITVMQNNKGKFTEVTGKLGLDGIKGFWNCVAFYDYNKDGMLDIVAGNSGLNHKLTGSMEKPIKMHVGDFDKNGATEAIIFYNYFNRYVPFASMDKLISQTPILKKKFNAYNLYKGVDNISKLFDNYKENQIEYKEVNESRSLIFLSEGGKYVAQPLSFTDQISDIQDIYLEPNGDIIYVGNNHDYIAENGRSTSNTGRRLSNYDPRSKSFAKSEKLQLPIGLNTRHIGKIGEGKYAVAGNSDYVYLLKSN